MNFAKVTPVRLKVLDPMVWNPTHVTHEGDFPQKWEKSHLNLNHPGKPQSDNIAPEEVFDIKYDIGACLKPVKVSKKYLRFL